MKRVNFRLTEIAYDQLKQLAASRGESMNAAVQYAVQSAVQSDVQNSTPKMTKNDTKCDSSESGLAATLKDEIEYLRRQIETKDEQISNLSTALLNAQKEVSNAQQLHGAEKAEKLLESGEVKEKHPWWKFWV
jgi:predicted RNase H-like nuclease (RuvC/YqgF family)